MYYVVFMDRPTDTTTRLEVANKQFASYREARRYADNIADSRHARVVREETAADAHYRDRGREPWTPPEEWGVRVPPHPSLVTPTGPGHVTGVRDPSEIFRDGYRSGWLDAINGYRSTVAADSFDADYANGYRLGQSDKLLGLPHRYDA